MPGGVSNFGFPPQRHAAAQSLSNVPFQRVTPFASARYGNELEGGRRDRFNAGYGVSESQPSIAQLPVQGASMHRRTENSLNGHSLRKSGGTLDANLHAQRTAYQHIKSVCSANESGPDPYSVSSSAGSKNWNNPELTQKPLFFGQRAAHRFPGEKLPVCRKAAIGVDPYNLRDDDKWVAQQKKLAFSKPIRLPREKVGYFMGRTDTGRLQLARVFNKDYAL